MENETYALPAIIGDNYDEMFLIGTKKELSLFANSILEFIHSEKESMSLCGKNIFHLSKNITDNLTSVTLDGVVMTSSELDKQNIIDSYMKNNGEQPIDWERRKK